MLGITDQVVSAAFWKQEGFWFPEQLQEDVYSATYLLNWDEEHMTGGSKVTLFFKSAVHLWQKNPSHNGEITSVEKGFKHTKPNANRSSQHLAWH